MNVNKTNKPLPKKLRKRIKLPASPTPMGLASKRLLPDEIVQKSENEYALRQKEWRNKLDLRLATEIGDRMGLLLNHYQIPEDAEDKWFILSFKLACDHIEGFKVTNEKKSGRPKVWDEKRLLRLFLDVQDEVAKGKSVSSACNILSKREYYKNILAGKKALQNRYNDCINSCFVTFYLETIGLVGQPTARNLFESHFLKEHP